MTDSPTTPPYSGTQSSSTPTPSQQYFQNQPPSVPTQREESRFNYNDWGMMVIGMLLTALIGYFSSLIAVKSDIAENNKDISVSSEKITHITSELSDLKTSLIKVNIIQRTTDEVSFRVKALEKNVEKIASKIDKQTGITKK